MCNAIQTNDKHRATVWVSSNSKDGCLQFNTCKCIYKVIMEKYYEYKGWIQNLKTHHILMINCNSASSKYINIYAIINVC